MRRVTATVGTFDGVHRGHRLVLQCLIEKAREYGDDPVVFTFDRHPLALIAPQRAPKRIMTVDEERRELEKEGVDVITLSFDEKLRSMTAGQWLQALHDKYGVRRMVMGYDNTFGCDGRFISSDDYRSLADAAGIDMTIAPCLDGISSSAVRHAIADGNIAGANSALGRPFSIEGTIVPGKALGRKIGFPTANLMPQTDIIVPAKGVYAAFALLDDGRRIPTVVNIGQRPTVCNDGNISIEAHLIGWSGNLYGKPMTLLFIARLRNEIRFDSLDSLKEQINADCESATALLGTAAL